jgi:uncharacterized membrane protein required for colicin V production
MNSLDLALTVLIVISVASGIRKGSSRSGFGFLAVVLAFLSAAWLSPANPKGFLIVFVALICAGAAGTFLLGRWFKSTGTKWLDGLLGGAFGLTNALLFSVFAVLALMAFAPRIPREYIARSSFAPYALEAACTASEIVPGEMKSRVGRSYAELEQVLPPKFRKAMPPLLRNEI